MSSEPRRRVVMVDGVPMSALVAVAEQPRGGIVAVHGGATSSTYFDCPGHPRLSLLRLAATQGFTAIALDRPGYGASALYADELDDPDRRAALAYAAVDKLLADGQRGAGHVLVAHSAGCELALRMAVSSCSAGLLGLELAGTGLRYQAAAQAVIREATTTRRPAGLRDLLWQPTEFYPPEVLTGALSASGVAYESEVTAHWARRDFPELAARVTVPVEFSVADHESVWESTQEAVAAITALFAAAPRVIVNEVAGSGHNLSVGLTAETYHRKVLAFIEECIAARQGLTSEVEAS